MLKKYFDLRFPTVVNWSPSSIFKFHISSYTLRSRSLPIVSLPRIPPRCPYTAGVAVFPSQLLFLVSFCQTNELPACIFGVKQALTDVLARIHMRPYLQAWVSESVCDVCAHEHVFACVIACMDECVCTSMHIYLEVKQVFLGMRTSHARVCNC